MSQILANVKKTQLQARKDRQALQASALTTLIGEVENSAKITGKPVTDEAVIATLKKFLKNATESRRIAGDYRDSDSVDKADAEIDLYNSFLPRQMNEAELRLAIQHIVTPLPGQIQAKPTIGSVMTILKEQHSGTYDGALASKLIKEIVG